MPRMLQTKKINVMKASVKINPTRIRVNKYNNSLMLLIEYATIQKNSTFFGSVVMVDEYFEIELNVSSTIAQRVKNYINANL